MAAPPENPKDPEESVRYKYSHLPSRPNSIRLLRLLAARLTSDPIKCQLFTYSLTSPPRTSHLYECLSYVWGDVKDKPLIEVDGVELTVTKNLDGALRRLRDPDLDRVLWVDAVCINQDDIEERAQQVQVMAMIYAYASRVIVWLGEEAEGSSEAMEVLREEASRMYRRQKTLEESNDVAWVAEGDALPNDGDDLGDKNADETDDEEGGKNAEDHIMAFFRRPWFRRIWVLQEIAAARVMTVLCGAEEITGAGFHRGLSGLLRLYDDPDLHSIVTPMIYLLGDASVLRLKKYSAGEPFRLDICPLYQLIDMFRLRQATDRRDKVYALLGIASRGPVGCELVPDYATEWHTVFRNLVRSILGTKIEADWAVQDGREYGRLEGKALTLGHISMVGNVKGEVQTVVVVPTSRTRFVDRHGWPTAAAFKWVLHSSTTAVQKGDVVCWLEGSTAATIIRPQGNLFTIAIVLAELPRGIAPNLYHEEHRNEKSVSSFPSQHNRPLHLVWTFDSEWTTSQLQDLQQSQVESIQILRLSSMARILEDINDTYSIAELVKHAAELFHHAQDLPVEAVEHFQHLSRAIPNWSLFLRLKELFQRVLSKEKSAVGSRIDVELDVVEFQSRLRANNENGTTLLKLVLDHDYHSSSSLTVGVKEIERDANYGPMLAFLFDVWGPALAPLSIIDFIKYVELLSPSERLSIGNFYNTPPMEVVELLVKATTEHPVWGKSMLEHLFEFAKGDIDRVHCLLHALIVCSSASPWWKQLVVECILATHSGEFVPDPLVGSEECYTAALEFLWSSYIVPAKDFVAISPSGAFQLRRQLLETFVSDYQFWKACYDGRTEVVQTHAMSPVEINIVCLCKDTQGKWCRVSALEAAAMNGHVDCFRALMERGFGHQITPTTWNDFSRRVNIPEAKLKQLTELAVPFHPAYWKFIHPARSDAADGRKLFGTW